MEWIVVPFSPIDQETADAMNKILNYMGDSTTDILLDVMVYGESFIHKEEEC